MMAGATAASAPYLMNLLLRISFSSLVGVFVLLSPAKRGDRGSYLQDAGCHESTVDGDDVAGNEGCVFGSQEADRTGDLLRRAVARRRCCPEIIAARSLGMEHFGERRVDGARSDSVDRDAVLGKLDGHLPSQADDRCLRCAIRGASRAGAHSAHRCQIDDATPFARGHQSRLMLAALHRAGNVDGHHLVPVVERIIDEREGLGNAGIVDQYVAALVALGYGRERRGDRGRTGYVHAHRPRCETLGVDLCRSLHRRLAVDVGDHHRESIARESRGNRRANAHPGAGYQRYLLIHRRTCLSPARLVGTKYPRIMRSPKARAARFDSCLVCRCRMKNSALLHAASPPRGSVAHPPNRGKPAPFSALSAAQVKTVPPGPGGQSPAKTCAPARPARW